jgi:glycogen operon protein
MGGTQRGNNNAYCQDNEVSWIDWALDPARERLREFAVRLIALRRRHPVLRRRDFFRGEAVPGTHVKDIVWLKPDGVEMTSDEWNKDFARCLGVYLPGDAMPVLPPGSPPPREAGLLMLFNAHHDIVPFRLPAFEGADRWQLEFDTAADGGMPDAAALAAGIEYPLQGRSFALLRA